MEEGVAFQYIMVFGFAIIVVVIVFFVSEMIEFGQTDCWTKTESPFKEKLLYGYMLQPAIGGLNNFIIKLYLDERCLEGIYFIERDKAHQCPLLCSVSKLDKSIIEECQQECYLKCGEREPNCVEDCGGNGDCILLMPKKTSASEGGWFVTRNKPYIYSSGDYKLNIPNELGVSGGGISPEDKVKCLIFERTGDTYNIKPSNREGDCVEV